MKKKITLTALMIIFSLNVFSQAPLWHWAKGIGGIQNDNGYSIAVDASGNVFTTGYFIGTVDFDPGPGIFNLTSLGNALFILKLNSSGNFVWAKAMNGIGAGGISGISIAFDLEGNIYTTGSFRETVDFDPGPGTFYITGNAQGSLDFFVSKLDYSGNFIWAKAVGGNGSDIGHSIAIDPAGSGNVYITGWFESSLVDFDPGPGIFNLSSSGNYDIFILKLDGSGNFAWAKRMGAGYDDWGKSIAIDTEGSGDVFITGHFGTTVDFDPGPGIFNLTSAGYDDMFISKLNSSGNFVWVKQMGGTGVDNSYSIALDAFGNVYTTGTFVDTVDFDPGSGVFNLICAGGITDYAIFISKLNPSGNFVWAKAMGGTDFNFGLSIVVDTAGSGDVYTSGSFNDTVDFDPGAGVFNLIASSGNFSRDNFISKLDSSGNFAWAKAAGGTGIDEGYAIAVDASHNVYVAGGFNSPTISFGSITLTNAGGSNYDIFIAKLDTMTIITGNNDASPSFRMTSIFPNPATTEATLNFGKGGLYDVQLCNTLGEILFETTTSGEEMKIDVRDFVKGIYFVVVRDGENSLVVRKVVKM